MLRARRILFILFFGIYVILCPTLIMYAFGYLFNPVKQELVYTGVLSVSTIPSGASIYLERSRYRDRTPASIATLKPGDYEVTLQLKGYRPWRHSVSIRAGKASAFEDIILVPKVWKKKPLLQEAFRSLDPLSAKGLLLLGRDRRLGSHALYDCRTHRARPLLPDASTLSDMPLLSVFKHRKEPLFIARCGTLWDRKYLVIDPAHTVPSITDITDLIDGQPIGIFWSDKNRDDVFVAYRDRIDAIDVKAMTARPLPAGKIKGFGLRGNRMYTMNDENGIDIRAIDGEETKASYADAPFGRRFFERANFWKISVIEENIFLFAGSGGQLITNLAPYELVSDGVKGFEFYEGMEVLLFWTDETIGMADFRATVEQTLFTSDVVVKHLYDKGRNLSNCFLTADGSHVVFGDQGGLFLLEIEPQGAHHLERLCDTKRTGSVFYSNDDGCAYYLDAKDGSLHSIEVIPRGRLFFAPLTGREAKDENRG